MLTSLPLSATALGSTNSITKHSNPTISSELMDALALSLLASSSNNNINNTVAPAQVDNSAYNAGSLLSQLTDLSNMQALSYLLMMVNQRNQAAALLKSADSSSSLVQVIQALLESQRQQPPAVKTEFSLEGMDSKKRRFSDLATCPLSPTSQGSVESDYTDAYATASHSPKLQGSLSHFMDLAQTSSTTFGLKQHDQQQEDPFEDSDGPASKRLRRTRGKLCMVAACDKLARGRGLCKRHGGGRRCQIDGCKNSARGGSHLCTSHGGGRRCQFEGCGKGAEGATFFCVAHGGGKRCTMVGCTKKDQGKGYCKAHGGGKRCGLNGCAKSAKSGSDYCTAHHKRVQSHE